MQYLPLKLSSVELFELSCFAIVCGSVFDHLMEYLIYGYWDHNLDGARQ